MKRRSFLAPEALQISSMDCGVGALTTFLAGYGVHTSYERLREACQTSVDGTSIDALDDLANDLGVEACQHLLPSEWCVDALERRLPAIVVTAIPGAPPHFVVVWRRVGDWVHVMDPGRGRAWLRKADLAQSLLITPVEIAPDEFRSWFAESAYRTVLTRRCTQLLSPKAVTEVQRELASPESAASLAATDAALRITARLDSTGRHGPGWRTQAFKRIRHAAFADPEIIPRALRGLTATAEGGLMVRGAVALAPERPDHPVVTSAPRSRNAHVITSAPEKPWLLWLRLARLLGRDARTLGIVCAIGLFAAALAAGTEVLAYRATWDAPRTLSTFGQRSGAVGVLAALLLLVTFLEAALLWGSRSLGRYLEVRLRVLTYSLLPNVNDEFVRSRPTSDLAYRAHGLSLGREFPSSVLRMVRAALDLGVSVVALGLLDAVNLAVATVGVVCLSVTASYGVGYLRDVDTRFLAHGARLLTIFLDALRGFRPVRLHGYQNAFRAEQDRELQTWKTTGADQTVARATLNAVTEGLGLLIVLALLLLHIDRSGDPRVFLVLAFWAFRIPSTTKALTSLVESYPAQRSAFARLLEIADAPATGTSAHELTESPSPAANGVRIELEDVSVLANGHSILSGVTLEIPPSQHVAVVGPSGAGKSSLASVLLGIQLPTSGAALVDGAPLDATAIQRLRAQTAWVDPAAQLWNDTLLSNLEYAARGHRRRDLLETFETSDLLSVLDGMSEGLGTPVGSEGRLVSGGEGQRIRLGRALLRAEARFVVLDEPFRGLDRKTRRKLAFQARLAWKRSTLLFISHDISHALDFDRVLVVDEGRVVEDGHPLELAATPSSRFATMLEAERRVLDETWAPRRWRQLRVDAGKVREVTP